MAMTPRRVALLASAVLVIVALLFFRPTVVPGPTLRDFEAYYSAGATWFDGGDPYGRDVWRTERTIPGVVATRDELLPFVGPPLGLPLWALFARLSYAHATLLWGTILAVAGAALAIASLRLAGGRDPASYAAVVLLGVSFGPLTSAVALGQVALVATAGVVLAVAALAAQRARSAVGAALLAALQPNLAVALVARLSDRRAWFSLAIGAAIALAGSLAAVGGFAGIIHYLGVLGAHTAAERTLAIQMTVTAIVAGLGANDAALAAGLAVAAAVVVVTVWFVRGRDYAPEARVAVACAALPLVLPFSHEHDLVIAFFPAVMCLRRARRALWLAASCATVAIAVDWLGLAQRPTGLAQSVALALAAALAATALSRGRLVPGVFVPLAVAGCVVVAGTIAAAHPLPVWPDGLGSTFTLSPVLDAADVWRAEQVQNGLAAPNVAAALLRLASLGGCALLWATSLAALRRPSDVPV